LRSGERSGSFRSRLLLVEPDSHRATQVRKVLARNLPAFEVETVAGPDKALAGLQSQRYDAVILGGGRHQWTGLEFLRAVCARASGIPVVLLSGTHHGDETLDPATASGCSCVLSYVRDLNSIPSTVLDSRTRQADLTRENASLRQQLQAWEQRYRSVVEGASDAIFLVDSESGRLLEVNQPGLELVGRSSNELEGVAAEDVVFCVRGAREKVTLQAIMAGGAETIEDLDLVRGDGRFVPVSIRVLQSPRAGASIAQVALRDLSADKSMEQLIQTEKLAALGRLAASLAHEINNPLQALCSSISLLSRGPLEDDKRARYVDIASREVERVVQLVQRMLDFYRPSGEERVLVSINDLVDDTLALASKQLQRCGVEVVKELGPGLPLVEAVASYLRQVFINLVLYHVEAMPEGGQLKVKTTFEEATDQLIISFSDTGEGISPDELPYVFEPFHSSEGKSAGPYLAVSYSIVEQHHGSMEVSSRAGQGTTFTVRLPVGGERSV
jgi:two-component system NtrC family sensor kinase